MSHTPTTLSGIAERFRAFLGERAKMRGLDQSEIITANFDTLYAEDIAQAAKALDCHDDLVAALKCFLDDERFQVAVGGNPIVVNEMLTFARAALAKAQP